MIDSRIEGSRTRWAQKDAFLLRQKIRNLEK